MAGWNEKDHPRPASRRLLVAAGGSGESQSGGDLVFKPWVGACLENDEITLKSMPRFRTGEASSAKW